MLSHGEPVVLAAFPVSIFSSGCGLLLPRYHLLHPEYTHIGLNLRLLQDTIHYFLACIHLLYCSLDLGLALLLPRYHLLHPDYIFVRIRELQKSFRLRVLLCHVDLDGVIKPLHDIIKTALLHDCTLIVRMEPRGMRAVPRDAQELMRTSQPTTSRRGWSTTTSPASLVSEADRPLVYRTMLHSMRKRLSLCFHPKRSSIQPVSPDLPA